MIFADSTSRTVYKTVYCTMNLFKLKKQLILVYLLTKNMSYREEKLIF